MSSLAVRPDVFGKLVEKLHDDFSSDGSVCHGFPASVRAPPNLPPDNAWLAAIERRQIEPRRRSRNVEYYH